MGYLLSVRLLRTYVCVFLDSLIIFPFHFSAHGADLIIWIETQDELH